jgi:Fe-S-cluster containining protein
LKSLDPQKFEQLPGKRISPGETFKFQCHSGLSCFNLCCRNLNLFLYPYDVVQLKRHLGINADQFIDRYTDLVMRPGHHFPEVLLRMADNAQQTCPFLAEAGCSAYSHRPDTCRGFPVEQGRLYETHAGRSVDVYFFRPPDFCQGQHEDKVWTLEAWVEDQEARTYHEMTSLWADLRRLFQQDPWGPVGFEGPKGKMAFMAAYNMDQFRSFVFESTFLKRYRVKPALVKKMRSSDTALLKFGFEWIRCFVWDLPSKLIQLRK